MGHVIQASLEEVVNMFVIERIIDLPTLSPPADKVQVAQGAQLVGYGRLAHLKRSGKIADAQLGFGQERYNAHPAGIAQGLECLGQADGGGVRQDVGQGCLDTVSMDIGFGAVLVTHGTSSTYERLLMYSV
jgi:hypothetical protein